MGLNVVIGVVLLGIWKKKNEKGKDEFILPRETTVSVNTMLNISYQMSGLTPSSQRPLPFSM